MAKAPAAADILVLGDHPAAYVAATLLTQKPHALRVMHATLPGETIRPRLTIINPALFGLHPLLKPLGRKFASKNIYGVQFLSDDQAVRSEHRAKSSIACIADITSVRDVLRALAKREGVTLASPRSIHIHSLDEEGVEVSVGADRIKPRALVLAGRLDGDQQRLLGMPDAWEIGILHRYTYTRLKGAASAELGARPPIAMSLDLAGELFLAWMLPGPEHCELAIQQPVALVARHPPASLLRHWGAVLHSHGVLSSMPKISDDAIESIDLPLAGALAHEGVANRTLLVGPAGGFMTASGEDVYPGCWSAGFAAAALKSAVRERHLQDALQVYRQKWRTTLGEYLRGPQQNLRFLLPLVYRNQVMTSRLAEAILLGKSVVR